MNYRMKFGLAALISFIFMLIAWIIAKIHLLNAKLVLAGWHTTIIEGEALSSIFILAVGINTLLGIALFTWFANKVGRS